MIKSTFAMAICGTLGLLMATSAGAQMAETRNPNPTVGRATGSAPAMILDPAKLRHPLQPRAKTTPVHKAVSCVKGKRADGKPCK